MRSHNSIDGILCGEHRRRYLLEHIARSICLDEPDYYWAAFGRADLVHHGRPPTRQTAALLATDIERQIPLSWRAMRRQKKSCKPFEASQLNWKSDYEHRIRRCFSI